MIWSLCYVNDKLIASGDSKGSMKLWDTHFGILKKEFNEHNADILTICCKNDTIYYTGSDSLISTVQNSGNEWLLTSKFRGQSHDINSICLLNDDCLVSGGLTTDICIYKLSNYRFIEKYDKKVSTSIKRHISAFEQRPKINFCYTEGRLLLLHRKLNSLDLWLVNELNIDSVVLLAEINKKSDNNIIASNISSKASYICYSDIENTVIFKYDFNTNEVKRIKKLKFSSKFLYFSRDESNLISISQAHSNIAIYNLKNETLKNINLDSGDVYISCHYLEEKGLIALSTLNRGLIVVDLNKSIVDTNYPHPDNFITQLKFISSEQLITVCDNNKFFILDLSSKKYSKWTNKNLNNFPKNYLTWYNKIYGIAANGDANKFILYTDYNYIPIDLAKEIPYLSTIEKNKTEKIRNADWLKRLKDYHKTIFEDNYKNFGENVKQEIFKENEVVNGENNNFKIVNRFSSILYMEYIDDGTLLVVENDWNKILKTFPDSIMKHKYAS
jgi:WD40 repeat protein